MFVCVFVCWCVPNTIKRKRMRLCCLVTKQVPTYFACVCVCVCLARVQVEKSARTQLCVCVCKKQRCVLSSKATTRASIIQTLCVVFVARRVMKSDLPVELIFAKINLAH